MRRLAALERLLERVFERSAARVFRAPLDPLVVQRRMERAIEEGRRREAGRTLVPDRVRVALQPDDLAGLGDPDSLASSLAAAALAFARGHGYALDERPHISIAADPGVAPGEPVVRATWSRGAAGTTASGTRQRGAPLSDSTRPFVAPVLDAPAAILVIVDRRGRREVAVDGRPQRLGRALDNDIVLDDPRVSRHHARLGARAGRLVLTDLGSANGVWVGGKRVAEAVLGPGDRIELGSTAIDVRPAGAT